MIFNLLMIQQIITISLLVVAAYNIYTTPPTWLTSNYFRAGNQNVIAGVTNQSTTPVPNHRFTFSTPMSGTPNLGYGIKAYEGYDYLGQQHFEVNRTYLDRFEFRVVVKIIGITNILLLNVPYIAIDPTFPHHLNSFDNVPVNYTAGPLVNISVDQKFTTSYTNIINYTDQASGMPFNTFLAPYNRNKILLFMTSLKFKGANQAGTAGIRPINLSVVAEPISSFQYQITVALGTALVRIEILHFSIVIFDVVDVQSSGKYVLVYQKITLPFTGGFIPIPSEFVDNFIMGLLEFTTNRTQSILDFQWNFAVVNGTHGVQMPRSVATTNRNAGNNTISTITYTMLYIKTWICPNQTFFDENQNLCTGCPIINCINCYNISVCELCDEPNDFFLNTTNYHCSACNLSGCLNCTSLTTCQQCNNLLGYALQPNGTCFQCSSIVNNFLNSSGQCEMCAIIGCQTCLNLASCSACDTSNFYYPNVNGTCSYCDPAAGYALLSNNTCFLCSSLSNNFLNSTTNQCQICSLTGCLTCTDLTTCLQCDNANLYYLNVLTACSYCDPAAGYALLPNETCFLCSSIANSFVNSTTNQCQLCSLVGCQTCLNLTQCSVCNATGLYYKNTNATCQYCDPAAGYALLANGTCFMCSSIANNFLNYTTNQCQLCTLTGCLACLNLTQCSQCDNSSLYYLNPLSTCSYCNSTLGSTLVNGTCISACSNASQVLNTTSLLCQPCAVQNCAICSTLTQCLQCNTSGLYYPTSSSVCTYCDPAAGYALLANDTCFLCNSLTNNFLNTSTNQCQLCSLNGCNTCLNLTSCSACNTTGLYYLNLNSTCSYCDPLDGYALLPNNTCYFCNSITNNFVNTTTNQCQTCILYECIICFNLTDCSVCNSSALYYLNSSAGCSYCDPLAGYALQANDTCFLCTSIPNNFINSSNDCELCSLTGCLICVNLTQCSVCDANASYYKNENETCTLCSGPNYFLNLTNLTCQLCSLQGCITCSSLEQCLVCNNANGYYLNDTYCYNCSIYNNCPSAQQLSNTIQDPEIKSWRSGCNSFIFSYKTANTQLINLDRVYFLNEGLNIVSIQLDGNTIQANVTYSRDIYKQKLQLVVQAISTSIQFYYDPLLPSLYYTEDQCKTQKSIKQLFQVAEIISYIVLITSLLSFKIVGLELFGVLQLSYISLASYDYFDIYLHPLTKFKTFNGLSLSLINQQSSLPSHLQQMSLSADFLNNCNVMLILLFAELLVSASLYGISKVIQLKKLTSISLHLLKQGFISLIFFNILNVSFSTGIQIKYSPHSGQHYLANMFVIGVVFVFVVGAIVAMQSTDSTEYGEYKNKFKDNWTCRLYALFSLLYRITLGLYIGLKNDEVYSTLIIIAISLAFVMYNIINLPFTDALQNYRCNFIHFTQLIILLSANYYRGMKMNTPMEIKGRDHYMAIIVVLMIMVCVVISTVILTYQIVKSIKSYLKAKKIVQQNSKIRNVSELTMEDIRA